MRVRTVLWRLLSASVSACALPFRLLLSAVAPLARSAELKRTQLVLSLLFFLCLHSAFQHAGVQKRVVSASVRPPSTVKKSPELATQWFAGAAFRLHSSSPASSGLLVFTSVHRMHPRKFGCGR